ncbi:sodium/hydrogen exchanger 3-like isoform X2 [Rutidosis leptorrhynchoides]
MFLDELTMKDSEAEYTKHMALVSTLLLGCFVLCLLLHRSYWLVQSIIALFYSILMGLFFLRIPDVKSSSLMEFNQVSFFGRLLPLIIFNAGFQVKRKQFFLNFLTITSFRVIGSLISFAIISLGATQLFLKFDIGYLAMKDYLALGAIYSAAESLCTFQVLNMEETPLLYSLALGEGVVNDATSMVFFNAIKRFNLSDMNPVAALSFGRGFITLFVCSTFLGIFVGLLCAYFIRTLLYFGRHPTERVVVLMLFMAYLIYYTADVCNLSGILATFFFGIVMSNYVTHKSQVTTKRSFASISYFAEVLSFIYVAMDSFDAEKWPFFVNGSGQSNGASGILMGLIMVGRAGFIFPISYLSYLTRMGGVKEIGIKQRLIVRWASLMRGAVSVALAYKEFSGSEQTIQPAKVLLLTSIVTVVIFSTVVFGLLTKLIIRMLLPRSDETEPSTPTSLTQVFLVNGHDHDHYPVTENGISYTKQAESTNVVGPHTVHVS